MQGDGRRLVVLFAVVPNPTVLRRHPQHPASAAPGSAPCRTRAFDRLVWPDRGFSPPYEISYHGMKPARLSAGLGRCGLWREADVPQVSSCDQM